MRLTHSSDSFVTFCSTSFFRPTSSSSSLSQSLSSFGFTSSPFSTTSLSSILIYKSASHCNSCILFSRSATLKSLFALRLFAFHLPFLPRVCLQLQPETKHGSYSGIELATIKTIAFSDATSSLLSLSGFYSSSLRNQKSSRTIKLLYPRHLVQTDG